MDILTPQSSNTPEESSNKKLIQRLSIITAAIVLPVSILVGVYALSPKQGTIPRGVTIGTVDVGGLTAVEAQSKASETFKTALKNEKITLSDGNTKNSALFSEFGAEYDLKKASEKAAELTKSTEFFGKIGKFISSLFIGNKIMPEIIFENDKLQVFVDNFSNEADDPVSDEKFKVDGSRLKIMPAVKGSIVDRQETQKLVADALRTGKGKDIDVKKVLKEPQIKNAMEIHSEIATEPIDAKIEFLNGKKHLSEHKDGIKFDVTEAQVIIDKNRPTGKSYYIPLTITTPKIKTWNLHGGLFKEVIAKYDSKLTNKESNRLNNVKLAAEKINGTVLQPGEEFSYNSAIGTTTESNGYKKANIYLSGKIEQGVGGGVCQVSSTLYSALLHSDLSVTKRFNHSMIVTYVPYGMDATVSNAQIDLRFVNNTNEPLKITANVDNDYVHVSLLGAKTDTAMQFEVENNTISTTQPQTIKSNDSSLPSGKEVVDQKGMVGQIVETYKIYKKGGNVIKRQLIGRSKYNVLDRLVRVGTGPAQPVIAPVEPVVVPTNPVATEISEVPKPTVSKPVQTESPVSSTTPEPKPTDEKPKQDEISPL